MEETSDMNNVLKTPITRVRPIKVLTASEEESLEAKLVWVTGSPRSGSTWLTHRLLKHPENILWNEPLIGHHLGSLTIQQDALVLQQKRAIDLDVHTADYFFSEQHKNNWLPALRTLILARAYSLARSVTKNVIIKEPNGSMGMDIIMGALAKAKLILLLRDGRDVIDSRIDMHSPGAWVNLTPIATKRERLLHIKLFARIWNKSTSVVLQAYNSHDPALRILVKYEELRTNTFSELKKIYRFLNIMINEEDLHAVVERYDFKQIPDAQKGEGKFNRTAKIGGWGDNFSEDEKELMNSIMGETLTELGYEV